MEIPYKDQGGSPLAGIVDESMESVRLPKRGPKSILKRLGA